MFNQQIVIDVKGATHEELAAAIKAAGAALATMSIQDAEETGAPSYSITRGPTRKDGYSPNTLYVVGTNADAKVVITSSRTSFDAHKDYHIMSSALELSQAVELRGVEFAEHKLGSLMVRPVPKAQPLRDVAQVYDLSHITDLAKLDDEDIAFFVNDVPGLIAMLKLAKAECDKRGVAIATVLPKLEYVADESGTVTVNSEKTSTTATGSAFVAGWLRDQAAAGACSGQCNVVRDEDALQHGCCQTCEKVVKLD